MKSLLLIYIIFGLSMQAPKKILNSFDTRYQSAEFVVWSFVDDFYQVSFEHFDQQKTAFFDCDGAWVQTTVSLQPTELMFCIRDFLKYQYAGSKVVQAYYVVTEDLCEYHVILETGNGGKESDLRRLQLVFDDNCEFMKNL
ncbi:MAG: hypothetical protein ABJG78_00705 [Cyclobacteriaceae bacterium]